MAIFKSNHRIKEIQISGFKSLLTKQTVSVKPLTILSGSNSSGKSSVTQTLLLLKQTIEAPYDPGALLLNGPNIKLTSANQLLARTSTGSVRNVFSLGLVFEDNYFYQSSFKKNENVPGGFELDQIKITSASGEIFSLKSTATEADIDPLFDTLDDEHGIWPMLKRFSKKRKHVKFELKRSRCFFELFVFQKNSSDEKWSPFFNTQLPGAAQVNQLLQRIIHVPGLRGNPERTYATTAVGVEFPGRFENYVASIIKDWQDKNSIEFTQLTAQLEQLGLTGAISAERVNDTEVELKVSRVKTTGDLRKNTLIKPHEMVSIADVGFGVSQTLPVLVALLAARKDQIVIIEQPELHLHPRAQTRLASIAATAIARGVRIIVETHSSLFLLGIQTAVAKGQLKNSDVALNWFSTNEAGHTKISRGQVSEFGSIGTWPSDFMDIGLEAESAFLDAVELRLATDLK